MPGQENYELHIDVFSPESIPMARLAEYMASFAELLGHSEHVHFSELRSGSLNLVARADDVARPKVDRRIDEAKYGHGPQAARLALKKLDDKLAEDNAVGSIVRGKAKLIEFPGRTRHVEEKLGPIQESGSLDGEVIQIGGKDETINVHLKVGDQVHHCVTSKAVARRLATHIFGAPIRLRGSGTWARMESGEWILKRFEIDDFSVLDESSLSKLFSGLRSRLGPPEEGRLNPVELMRQLRQE